LNKSRILTSFNVLNYRSREFRQRFVVWLQSCFLELFFWWSCQFDTFWARQILKPNLTWFFYTFDWSLWQFLTRSPKEWLEFCCKARLMFLTYFWFRDLIFLFHFPITIHIIYSITKSSLWYYRLKSFSRKFYCVFKRVTLLKSIVSSGRIRIPKYWIHAKYKNECSPFMFFLNVFEVPGCDEAKNVGVCKCVCLFGYQRYQQCQTLLLLRLALEMPKDWIHAKK
jgi:hypothetical protein